MGVVNISWVLELTGLAAGMREFRSSHWYTESRFRSILDINSRIDAPRTQVWVGAG